MLLEHGQVLFWAAAFDHLEQGQGDGPPALVERRLSGIGGEREAHHGGSAQDVAHYSAALGPTHQPHDVTLPLRGGRQVLVFALLLSEGVPPMVIGIVFVRQFWGRYPLHLVPSRPYGLPNGYHGRPSGALPAGGKARDFVWRAGPRAVPAWSAEDVSA